MGSYQGGPRPSGGQQKPASIPAPNRVTYFAKDETLDPELLDAAAEAQAKKLKDVSRTQLRRFYEHVLAFDRRLRLESEGEGPEKREAVFNRMRADFKMLKAKAVYAAHREQKQLPREFLQFFVDHVNAVRNARDFDAFRRHFEAVVAFHRCYGDKER